jgi:hypothetical protein
VAPDTAPEDEGADTAPEDEGAGAAPEDEGADEREASGEAPSGDTVSITLVGVPQPSRLRVDGRRHPLPTFELPNDGAEHRLELEVRGYRTWRHTVTGDRDRTFRVDLVPRRRRR